MMNENEYRILEPRDVASSNHGIQDWALRLCVFSSIAFSFGAQANTAPIQKSDLSPAVYIPVCDGGEVIISQELVSKLNSNAEIKDRLISRLLEFKNTLQQGWNGGAELPMEEQSISNALAAIDSTESEEFENWTVFPSPNGTILFSPTNDLIGGISIGNDDFSYAAIGEFGQEIKGKEVFSVRSFKLAIRLINSLNQV